MHVLNNRIEQICALERNQTVRQKIKDEFPETMRRVLEYSEEDIEKVDSTGENRFDKIADDLQVFCVSSQDFLRIKYLQDGSPSVCHIPYKVKTLYIYLKLKLLLVDFSVLFIHKRDGDP